MSVKMRYIFYLFLVSVVVADDIESKVIDTDLIKVQLPDNVSYTLIVVLVSYMLKMIFDVIYRLRKMECRWGACCFCRGKFDDGDDEEMSPQCPACSPHINVNVGDQSDTRRTRLRSILVDSSEEYRVQSGEYRVD